MLFVFFFVMINLYFSFPAATAQIFNPTAELVIPIGVLTNEANAGIEIQPLTAEMKIRRSSK